LAALVLLVDRRPGPAFGFLLGNAALLVTLLDMVGLALLLGGIGTLGHLTLLYWPMSAKRMRRRSDAAQRWRSRRTVLHLIRSRGAGDDPDPVGRRPVG